jgi:benzoyl-CoA reductase/2-hydroxyglutaryl-CoA dehydratase subunit BcrC/BadD/HgdB
MSQTKHVKRIPSINEESSMIKFKSIIASMVSLMSINTYAFHSITEILPSKKILICKDFNQVRNGRKVEVYVRQFSTSRSGLELVIAKEFELPKIGDKVELYHRETHLMGKNIKLKHNEKIGTATVVETNLAGESINRQKVSQSNRKTVTSVEEPISNEEASKLKLDCLLIKPDSEVDFKNINVVSF